MLRFYQGFLAFFSAYRFIKEHKLWRYVAWPAVVSFLTGVLMLAFSYWSAAGLLLRLSENVTAWMAGLFGFQYSGLPGLATFFVRALALVIAGILSIILYRGVSSITVIPFMGPLLNQVEKIRLGRPIQITLVQDLKNSVLGGWTALKFAVIGLIVLLIGLFLGPFHFIANVFVQGYFLGRSGFDYIFEKECPRYGERGKLVKSFRPEIFGMGTAFFLWMFVPLLGFVLGPAFAVVAAAILYHPEARQSPGDARLPADSSSSAKPESPADAATQRL